MSAFAIHDEPPHIPAKKSSHEPPPQVSSSPPSAMRLDPGCAASSSGPAVRNAPTSVAGGDRLAALAGFALHISPSKPARPHTTSSSPEPAYVAAKQRQSRVRRLVSSTLGVPHDVPSHTTATSSAAASA